MGDFWFTTQLTYVPHQVHIEWDWTDQGWGPRQGHLALFVIRHGKGPVGSVDLCFGGPAPHYWEHRTVIIEDEAFLGVIREGDKFEIWNMVSKNNAAQKHELHVANFTLRCMGGPGILGVLK